MHEISQLQKPTKISLRMFPAAIFMFLSWNLINISARDGGFVLSEHFEGNKKSQIKACNMCKWSDGEYCISCIHEGYEAKHVVKLKLHSTRGSEGVTAAIQLAKENHKLFESGKVAFALRKEGPFGGIGYDDALHPERFSSVSRNGFHKNATSRNTRVLAPFHKSEFINYVPIRQMKDSLYIGTIRVGTPPQVVHPIFDTGSTNLWVVGTKCKSLSCTKVSRYDPNMSRTYRELVTPHKIQVKFGTGEIEGSAAADTIRLGEMVVPGQSFAIVEREGSGMGRNGANIFNDISFEGIVGLAFPEMSGVPGLPFFDNLALLQHFEHKEFSFYIGDENDDSMVMFGGVNPNFFMGEIKMFPVVREHYWEVALDAIYVGDQKFCCEEKSYVIFDSGTSLNTIPSDNFSSFIASFPHEYCDDSFAGYPTITYVLSGERITLEPRQYMMKQKGICVPAYMQLDVPSEFGHAYIVGSNAFMRHYFTVFRRGNGEHIPSMVGVAPSRYGMKIPKTPD